MEKKSAPTKKQTTTDTKTKKTTTPQVKSMSPKAKAKAKETTAKAVKPAKKNKVSQATQKQKPKKTLVPIIATIICIAVAAPLLWHFAPWETDDLKTPPAAATPLRAEPVSAATIYSSVLPEDDWEMAGISSDDIIGGKKYSELPFRVLDSFSDGHQNYFLVDMGYVNNTHVSTSHLVYYNGQSPITASVTSTTKDSIANSTTNTVTSSYSFTDENSFSWSLGASTEIKGGIYFSASFSHTWGSSSSVTQSSERARETSFESIIETTNSVTTEFTVGENNEQAGWYRYGLYAIVDVYVVLTTDISNENLLHWETSSGIRTNSLFPFFEYSDNGSFDNAPLAEKMLSMPDNFWNDLPIPSREGQSMFDNKIAAGDYHSLYIDAANRLWGFGLNTYGQLGDGTTKQRTSPVHIKEGTTFSAVSTGAYHSLAIDTNGNLWAWGYNHYGQVGDFTNLNRYEPISVFVKKKFIQISAGASHSLAIDEDGNLWAWGYNAYGQLGNGTTVNNNYPIQVTADSGNVSKFKSISAGAYYSLALDIDGNLWAFGRNTKGQLGNSSTSNKSTPVQISATALDNENITEFRFIDAGNEHSLAIDKSGNLWAWGNNDYGQLGDGSNTQQNSPVQITANNESITLFRSIVAGNNFTMAIDINGDLRSCGLNNYGQLGIGNATNKNILTAVSGSYINFATISLGQHCLAIDSGGELWAWGCNGNGQLGIGNTTNRNIPQLCQ